VGALQRFEKRLEGMVEGAFAKVFKGVVHPVELLNAMQREADAQKKPLSGGRMLVRNVLYMACMTASYKNAVIRPYYEQMTARGMPHKSAMMACIRRLLAHMNEQIRLLLESRAATTSAA